MQIVREVDERSVVDAGENGRHATYARLRDLMVHGQLAPGSRLIEASLAERLGVSRTPVREALQRLQHEGFIEGGNGNGRGSKSVVAPLTERDGRELFALLGLTERGAAREAAELPDAERRSLVEELRSVNQSLRSGSDDERSEANRWFARDAAFHRGLVEAGAGRRLRSLHHSYRLQAERYARFYLSPREEQTAQLARENEDILRAVEAGESSAAADAAENCWARRADRLGEKIQQVGERGQW